MKLLFDSIYLTMHNSKRVFAEVSITAKPFFEAKGFKVVKQQIVDIKGVKLTNFIMENIKP